MSDLHSQNQNNTEGDRKPESLIFLEDLQDLIALTEQEKGLEDPSLANLYASMGKIYGSRVESGECENFQQDYELAIEYLRKAIELQKKLDSAAELSENMKHKKNTRTELSLNSTS